MAMESNVVLGGMPSKVSCYVRGLVLPRSGFHPGGKLPRLGVVRRGWRVDRAHLARFLEVCGWQPAEHLPLVYPLTLTFGYHMSIFAHRDFPFSYVKLLGLRNHVLQRRPMGVGETFDLECKVVDQREMPKGLEFDLHTALLVGGEPVWECVHVYFLRGRFGGGDGRPVAESVKPIEKPEFEASWACPAGGGWSFARISGDFNAVHYSSMWARLLGFKRHFSHTLPLVSGCLRRLPEIRDAEPLRLDVLFKGPVYYGSGLVMKGARDGDGYGFELFSGGSDKPAIRGALRNVEADHRVQRGPAPFGAGRASA